MILCFHSINIPSEWGPQAESDLWNDLMIGCFHSINIPSEWGLTHNFKLNNYILGFHSINIPSEWGPLNFKPLRSKVSRGSFRRSGKKTNKKTKNQRPKTLKPLPSKGTKFATKKSTFQPFYLTFGQHHTLVSEITKQ